MAAQADEIIDGGVDRTSPGVDLKTLIKLRYKNRLSLSEIARQTGMPKSTVHLRLSEAERILGDPETIEAYRDNTGVILSAVERAYINDLMDPDRRKKASLNNVAYAFGQIHQARRLEEGLSTANQASVEVILQEIHDRRSGGSSKASDQDERIIDANSADKVDR